MSYLQSDVVTINRTGGSVNSTTGDTNVFITMHSSTQQGDCAVAVAYCGGNPTGIKDMNYGFRLFTGYAATGYGLIIGIARARGPFYSENSWTLLSSMAWISKCRPFYIDAFQLYKFDIANAVSAENFYSDDAEDTTITINQRSVPYGQCIEIVGFGFNNGGTVKALQSFTDYTELTDDGVTDPPYNTSYYYKIHRGAVTMPSQTVTISASGTGTNRCSMSVFIPIISSTVMPRRFCSNKRYG